MKIEDFVFNLPLYTEVGVKDGYEDIVETLKGGHNNSVILEGYNAWRKKESTFYLEQGLGNYKSYDLMREKYSINFNLGLFQQSGVKNITFICQRYHNELVTLVYHDYEKSTIMKVGQYPSVADIHIGEIKQYNKVLNENLMKEFTKAIGLAANGVGIGSFVYLRRIFEQLIIEALNEAVSDNPNFDKKQFEASRVDEKIDALKEHLPKFLYENKRIYGILSKGIHELTEEECLTYFDCMRSSIELILDEKLDLLQKKTKEENVRKQINLITSKVNK